VKAKSKPSYDPVEQHVARLNAKIVRRSAYKTEAAHYLAKRKRLVKFIELLVVIKVNAERVCSERENEKHLQRYNKHQSLFIFYQQVIYGY
jgi:hypothetical protein